MEKKKERNKITIPTARPRFDGPLCLKRRFKKWQKMVKKKKRGETEMERKKGKVLERHIIYIYIKIKIK